jgi:hypothetical protein
MADEITPRLRVISLGAGVQSTTMALMAAHGEIGPMPDAAIFSDTGWEPKSVYDHLNWLRSPNVLPFPVHVISAGNIREDALAGGSARAGRFASIPWFTINPDGSRGMGRRQCTSHYKVEPIQRKVRELLGYKKRQRIPEGLAEVWIGISTDEIQRMKDSGVGFMKNRWPLIESRVSRDQCLAWMNKMGYPTPPKSSCIGCPFHTNEMWRDIKENDPAAWADALEIDKSIRDQTGRGVKGQQFMHAQRVPMDQVDLRTRPEKSRDAGQLEFGFLQECEGMCGV